MQERESQFGITWKMLVKLAGGSKVWCTVPAGSEATRGDVITFKATFEVSKDDPSFAFGSRPTFVSKVDAA